MAEVEARIGVNKRTVQRMIKAESFPQPVRLNERSIGFVEAEIEAWMTERMTAHRVAREDGDD